MLSHHRLYKQQHAQLDYIGSYLWNLNRFIRFVLFFEKFLAKNENKSTDQAGWCCYSGISSAVFLFVSYGKHKRKERRRLGLRQIENDSLSSSAVGTVSTILSWTWDSIRYEGLAHSAERQSEDAKWL